MKFNLVTVLVIAFFASCKSDPNKQIDEGKITENIYHSEEIGWTMEIPKGWSVTHRSELSKRTEKGLNAINETVGSDYDASELKQLLNFEKDRAHIFQSTSEPFDLEYEGEWEENSEGLKELIYEIYSTRDIKVDTSSSKEIIDNLEFHVFHIKMYGPDGKVMLYQDMYGKLINGYDFGANLSYINDKEKNELMSAWKNSKFE